MTDPIADMLTRLRNAARARKAEFTVPYSTLKSEIARILEKEGYIAGFELETPAKGRIQTSRSENKFVNKASAIARSASGSAGPACAATSEPMRFPRVGRHGHRCAFDLARSSHGSRSAQTKRWRGAPRLHLVTATMSRIGRKPIEVPAKVKVNIGADGAVTVEGPRGKLAWNLPEGSSRSGGGQQRLLDRQEESRQAKALARSLPRPDRQYGGRR